MSEFTENVVGKGKQIADMACQKSMEIVEKAKINVKIQDTKVKVKNSYEQLGRIVYEKIKKGEIMSDEQMRTVESDIDSANYRIMLLKRELNEIKGATVCPKCGAINSENAKFCSECAAPIKE